MGTTLLYFAPVRWDDYPQRPHSFVRYFLSRPGRSVIWIDPYPSRFPRLSDLGRKPASRLSPPIPNLEVISPRALPLEPLAAGRSLNRRLFHSRLLARLASRLSAGAFGIGVGRPSDLALQALDRLKPAWSVFDAMDDFPEFYSGRARVSTDKVEREVAERVTAIVTPATALWDKFEPYGSRRVMIRNAFEMTGLPAPRRDRTPSPVFGYVGCISAWFDWPAVERLARQRPDASIEIVGPRFSEPATRPSNLRLFPACSHERIVEHLQRFSVGLIPFKRNRLTAGVDPIKYYAYRAMGLPVLTTRFGEMENLTGRDATFHMDGSDGLAGAAAAALATTTAPEAIARFRAAHDWNQRFEDSGLFDRMLRL